MSANQEYREVAVKTALGNNVLLFCSMSGSEQLGRLSEFRVQLLSKDDALKIADVLGKPLSVELKHDNGSTRYFHGIVTRFASTGSRDGFATYQATVHSWLWLLKRSSNCRIFQDKSLPTIIKQVCDAYGGVALKMDALSGNYPLVPYCVQYRESDFDFVCRLLEGVGIYFYFTHDAQRHTMVLADSYGAHTAIPGYGALKYNDVGEPGGLKEECVSSWSAAGEIVSSSYVLNDFDFEKTTASRSGGLLTKGGIAAGFDQTAYEMFDYPGNYTVAENGNVLARARMEALHGQCEQISANTDARGLFAGGMFTLAEHPREDQNRAYLITSLAYDIGGNDYTSGAGNSGLPVACQMTAIGKEFSYRPPAIFRKPYVQGPQTAMVVGKAGEEIWTDQYGRVKVQFHWDRVGKDDEHSSCWVRVAQSWAGKGWGTIFIPRIGMEVVVSFL
ncbi:type VI secretion system Vgr family protein, partial [Glaciimonas sp. GG7]